ncbi:MAG: hypothetical protein Q4D41_00300 [Prevotellaceae bacterium]|nr:hypothetical protein [Prevotellaceae bacterium]
MAVEIMTILQWAIPSGGIGAAIAWVANRKVNQAKAAKDVHDTYKAMYEDISRLLEETQNKYAETTKKIDELKDENARTRRALNRLSRAIEAIQLCPHRSSCPVSGELRLDEDSDDKPSGDGKKRQRGKQKERDNNDVDITDKGGHSEADHQDRLDKTSS